MNNIIKFKALDKRGFETAPPPYPAVDNIPDWFRNATPYYKSENNPDGKKFMMINGESNANFKKCTPMLDAMMVGYIISSWADIYVAPVEQEGVHPEIQSRTQRPVFTPHADTTGEIQAPPGYSNYIYKYNNTWVAQTPPGYSILVVPLLGHRDVPFSCVPAIIDSDEPSIELAPPMFLKEGFSGIIERETPLFQVIPFKRDNWKAEIGFYEPGEFETIMEKGFGSHLISHYARKVWKKKTFK